MLNIWKYIKLSAQLRSSEPNYLSYYMYFVCLKELVFTWSRPRDLEIKGFQRTGSLIGHKSYPKFSNLINQLLAKSCQRSRLGAINANMHVAPLHTHI